MVVLVVHIGTVKTLRTPRIPRTTSKERPPTPWRRSAAGAINRCPLIGGALAAPYYYGPYPGYYPGPYYPAPAYYGGQYGGQVPGDAAAYCMQRFRSYDPRSGTYLGNDGARHRCP